MTSPIFALLGIPTFLKHGLKFFHLSPIPKDYSFEKENEKHLNQLTYKYAWPLFNFQNKELEWTKFL